LIFERISFRSFSTAVPRCPIFAARKEARIFHACKFRPHSPFVACFLRLRPKHAKHARKIFQKM